MPHSFRRFTGTALSLRLPKKFLIPLFTVCLVASIAGCGGGGGSSTKPPEQPDFSLALTPSSLSITAGATGSPVSVTATALYGFTGAAAVSVTGLPAGVTASPATVSLTPGVAQSITLTAASSAAAGTATVTFTGVSGTLSHTATLALTVAAAVPAADFSLALNPTTLSIAAGGTGASTAVTATALNGFSGTVAVALSGLPTGVTAAPATLSLTPGTAQLITLTAGSTAVAGTATITITGTSGALTHTAMLALTITAAATPSSSVDVTTWHYDNARDGLNASETILTTANVNSSTFGLLRTLGVDGMVDAQPLYLSGLTVGGALHNVVYVATEHDSVYAFDASSGALLWKVSALGSGETTSDDHGCNQISPEIGITATPVIDRKQGPNGTIFVVAMSKDSGGAYHQRLHALDVTTGAEIAGSPTEIAGTYPGTGDNSSGGNVVFDPGQYAERIGLLLMNGTVYLGWTSHCDIRPYTGWVMAYSESTLKQMAVLNLTPNGNDGALWMSGAGMAADSSGNIFFLDANGTFDTTMTSNGFPAQGDFGNSMIKLSTAGNTLAVADYWEPLNTGVETEEDTDLGSGGALLLPDLTDASGAVHHLLVGAGKDGNIYVGNRDNLGKFNPAANTNLVQQLTAVLPKGEFAAPAYFNNTVYYGGVTDTLRAFPITNALLATAATSMSATTYAYPGTTPSVSANGTANGIVWAVEANSKAAAVLHAYDATNLGTELYNSNQAASGRDAFGLGNKFLTPVVANGQVYVTAPNGVAVFGLLPVAK